MLRKWLLLEEAEEGKDLAGGPAEPQGGEDSSAKWAGFLLDEEEEPADLDDEESPVTEEPAPDAAPEESAPTQETPAAPEGQETPTAPAVQPPPQPVITPEQLKAYRTQFSEALEANYAFDEEQATALQVEPEKVLPKLAARLHMEVLDNVMQHVYSALPNVIQSYTETSTREQKAQDEFFGAWPELKGHDQQVLQMGQMYRQMNPAATPQEAIQRIGEMTMVALGKQRKAAVGEAPAPTVPPPYRPAAPGRVGSPPPAKNKWESLMDDDD